MASYLVTGASRGLGFEFISQLSSDPNNTVIGLVRNKPATLEKVDRELKQRANLHILQADITDYEALKASVDEVSKITGGSLDYIIANAAFVSTYSAWDTLGSLGKDHKRLGEDLLESFNINVVGNIHLFNLYMPLILKGKVKKVATISSGMADIELIARFSIASSAPYSISKAGMNVAVAKFSAEYSKDGVLFLSISPGLVDTSETAPTEDRIKGGQQMMAQFAEYAPHFKGPTTAESSVKNVLSVINQKSVEAGDGGSFVSHFGNKQWL
ncbi:hypothetical protein BGZ61DRAFT_551684 [Ilyonectria robusta]|uniref:uncharacterized protein n=1 Tax=Ilyonectria robusta TaxID=1079257 RepID=UPI001E8E3A2A|nr:uncharacterized protein BGZ61DRAFT_551684 [Ilyonectria robusta]KAH8679221.1 hypothetical protein BGZ61DRAFT_551684 [Ilyonectria robusta]